MQDNLHASNLQNANNEENYSIKIIYTLVFFFNTYLDWDFLRVPAHFREKNVGDVELTASRKNI